MQVLREGPRRTVAAYINEDGVVEAIEFLDSLSDVENGRYIARMMTLCETGRLTGNKYHPLDPKKDKEAKGLAELKDVGGQTRIITFDDPSVAGLMILTHGLHKKENKLSRSEILRANETRNTYLRRRKAAEEAWQRVTQHQRANEARWSGRGRR